MKTDKKTENQKNTDSEEEQLIESISKLLLEDDIVYEARKTSLVSAAMLKKRRMEEIKKVLKSEELKNRLLHGFHLIWENINTIISKEDSDNFFKDIEKLDKKTLNNPLIELLKRIKKEANNLCLQKMIGLSDKSLLHIYTLAYHYFQQDKHDDSLAVFTVLVLFNPGISDFWNGLGLCYQAKENWEKALESFVMARTTNPTNMLPKLSLIECYWHLQKIIEAKEELEIVTEIREKDPHLYEKWSADIERLTTILKKAII